MTLEEQVADIWSCNIPAIMEWDMEHVQEEIDEDLKIPTNLIVDFGQTNTANLRDEMITSTVELISNNVVLALTSPSAYIRGYANMIASHKDYKNNI